MSNAKETIKTAMAEQGMTMYRLAQSANIPRSSVRLALSDNGNPTLETLEKLCEVLKLEVRICRRGGN